MGSDAFRSLFTLYQSKIRVSAHLDTINSHQTGQSGETQEAVSLVYASASMQVETCPHLDQCSEHAPTV